MTKACLGVLALLGVGLGLGLVACSDDDDSPETSPSSTTMATGGIEIAAPEGWTEIPLPVLGFGVAVPEGWEAVRLDEEGLASLGRATPVVPGFAEAAHNAYTTGSVLYAAGVDAQGRVADLKVRAETQSGVTDAAGLEALARQHASDGGLQGFEVSPGTSTDGRPTAAIKYQTGGDPAVQGTELLVLGPRGVVYSLILTSEDPATQSELAGQLFPTLAFPPA